LPATELCRICTNLISGDHYRINGQIVCSSCAVRARTGLSSASQAAYTAALVFGIGASIFGLILFAGFTLSTHITIGYVSLAVGWMVGNAMKEGSNGLGGGRHQITAALLTYAAISLAAIPVAVYDTYNHQGFIPDLGAYLHHLLMLGLASPFMGLEANPASAGISLIILFAGLRIAWQATRRKPLSVSGPYNVTA
jgi:hypothetical protein